MAIGILFSLISRMAIILAFLLKILMSNNIVLAIILSFFSITLIVGFPRLWLSNGSASEPQPDHSRVSRPESLKPMRLKLLIDKNRNRVLFAECDKDFVNVLLSFLLLPMGKIIRLSDKQSGIGSMDELYKSVEALNTEYFSSKACKNMLLEPRTAYGSQLDNLAVKIDETDYTKLYSCSKTPCLNGESFGLVSLVENSICVCGKPMNNSLRTKNSDKKEDSSRGFVNRVARFIVTDDLEIVPATISNTRSVLMRRGIRDNSGVQEWNVNIGLEEVLMILHRSLHSKTPLSDVFSPNGTNVNTVRSSGADTHNPSGTEEEIKAKLWFSKSTNRVICVEAKEDFVDFLFSFLTLPLGSIIKTLKGKSSLGSIDNLYKSAEKLSLRDIICGPSKGMLLSPKLERMFGCKKDLLGVEEEAAPLEFVYKKCYSCCLQKKKQCKHKQFQRLKITNPKIPFSTKPGGGFVRGQGSLLVTDNLVVEPLSPASGMSRLDHIPFSDLEHIQVIVRKQEAIALLKAALTSKTVLSQAFSSQVVNRNHLYRD